VIEAVIFDLDGVLIDSETWWDRARRQVVEQAGLQWPAGATEAMMGMSSPEWSAYLRENIGVPLRAEEINQGVVDRLLARYREHLPLVPGAVEAVRRMAAVCPVGLASSSNRPVIDAVLDLAGLAPLFQATVSSEEVAHGKPDPDVYIEAAHRLGVVPRACAVIEDSANGIRAGVAAEMGVIAIPNQHFPPPPDVLALATVVLDSISGLTPRILA
jgi:HAD superfamily hydrolase (TIGR01509 family)